MQDFHLHGDEDRTGDRFLSLDNLIQDFDLPDDEDRTGDMFLLDNLM